MFAESPPSYRSVVVPQLVTTGIAIPVWYDEIADPPAPSRQLEGLTIPSFPQLYKKVKGTMPSGEYWEAYRTLYEMNNALLRLVALPPGAPREAIEALRRAVERLAHDKEFAAESMKVVEYVPEYETAPDLSEQVAQGDGGVAADARLHQRLHAQRPEEVRTRRRMLDETRRIVCALLPSSRSRSASSGAAAQEPYYKGKRLTVLINFAAGGPTDIEGRLFAKYLAKHIPGQPNVIVQNMDGAGGVIGAQFVGEVAPKDGTVMGYFAGTSWIYVSDPERWRVDFKAYEFIAYQPGTTVHFVRTDVAPGMKTPADIVKAQGLVAGGLSIDTSKDLRLRMGLDMLGVPFKYVTGYRSSAPARRRAPARRDQHVLGIAAELSRAGRAGSSSTTAQAIPVWWDDVQRRRRSGAAEADGGAVGPDASRSSTGSSKARSRPARCGTPTRRIFEINSTLQRLIALPPGAPRAAYDALQPGDRAPQQRQGVRRRGDEGHPVRAGISDRARHEPEDPLDAGRVAGDAQVRQRLYEECAEAVRWPISQLPNISCRRQRAYPEFVWLTGKP